MLLSISAAPAAVYGSLDWTGAGLSGLGTLFQFVQISDDTGGTWTQLQAARDPVIGEIDLQLAAQFLAA